VLALGPIQVGQANAWTEQESAVLRGLVDADRNARKNEELALYGLPPRYGQAASTPMPMPVGPWWAQLLVWIVVSAFVVKLVKVHTAKEKKWKEENERSAE
jgi:hypothetical protein